MLIIPVILLLTVGTASAQSGNIQITNVAAPASIPAGQQFTIAVTISFSLPTAQSLIVALMPSIQTGYPYPTSEVSGSPFSCAISTNSVCNVQLPPGTKQGTFTASFTLNAPELVGSWSPVAVAYWGSSQENYKTVTITITQPLPETPSPFLLLIAALIVVATLVKRKSPADRFTLEERTFR
ncbi:MAG TPA: hypothetical protein VLV18_10435 [Terriglobales bacterium]|nr:hypothetical protein [Terriglobales bacterium]